MTKISVLWLDGQHQDYHCDRWQVRDGAILVLHNDSGQDKRIVLPLVNIRDFKEKR